MQPEKLNLWDRLFNRHRKEYHDRGVETWKTTTTYGGSPIGEPRRYDRNWIEYKIVDRLTGGYVIEREYIN